MRKEFQALVAVAVLVVIGLFAFPNESKADRLLKSSEPNFTEVNMREFEDSENVLNMQCSTGGLSDSNEPGLLTSSSQFKKCTTYTTTNSAKIGAIKIIFGDGTTGFVDIKQYPY